MALFSVNVIVKSPDCRDFALVVYSDASDPLIPISSDPPYSDASDPLNVNNFPEGLTPLENVDTYVKYPHLDL